MDMIKELASDEKAYRSLTLSWFNNSSLLALLKGLSENDIRDRWCHSGDAVVLRQDDQLVRHLLTIQ